MLAIEQNPRIKQTVATKLKRLGVSLVATDDERTIKAEISSPVYLDDSGRIFKELSRLGINGYDQKSLHIDTVEGVINVSFTLN
jgi:hypothetical protein